MNAATLDKNFPKTWTNGEAAVAIAALPFVITWKAFVLAKLWLWFVVPLGAFEISIANMAGLYMFYVWFSSDWKHKREEFLKALIGSFLVPGLILSWAFVVHLFM